MAADGMGNTGEQLNQCIFIPSFCIHLFGAPALIEANAFATSGEGGCCRNKSLASNQTVRLAHATV